MLMALLMAGAAWLFVGPSPQRVARVERTRRHRRLPAWAPLPVAVLVGVALLVGVQAAGWVLIAGIGLGAMAWLTLRDRAVRARRRAEADTASAAASISLLLRSGQIPSVAVQEAAADAPFLAPVAAAIRLGGDVGDAFVELSAGPGRGGFAEVGAAWRISERTGAPVATVLAQVSEALRSEREVLDTVESELSAARASGRIMAALPLAAVGLGMLVGADPINFLFHGLLGQALVLGAVALTSAGLIWIQLIAEKPLKTVGS